MLELNQPIKERDNHDARSFDCCFSDTPIHAFLRWYVQTTGNGVVLAESLNNKAISLNLRKSSPTEIIGMAARVLGVNVAKIGQTYYMGETKKTDSAAYVCKISRLQKDDINQIIRPVLSEAGTVASLENGITVITDSPEQIAKAQRTIAEIEAITQDCWVIQLMVVSSSRNMSDLLGIEASAADIGISAAINNSSTTLNFTASIESKLQSAKSSGMMTTLYAPLVIANDGITASLHSGRTYRYQQYTTSQYGISSPTDIKEINEGLKLALLVRQNGVSDAILSCKLELSSVVAIEKDLPITADRTLDTNCNIQTGGMYVLGRLEYESSSRNKSSGIATYFKSIEEKHDKVYILARCYRIAALKPEFQGVQNE